MKRIYPDSYDLHKHMQFNLGRLSGLAKQWRKRCSVQYILGYLSGMLGRRK